MKTVVSIIIPVYKQTELLKKCLDAVKKSSFWNYYLGEIIIVNNSPELKKRLQSLTKNLSGFSYQIITNKQNLGFSKACNLGVEHSTGDLLFFLNSDVIILKNVILGLIRFLHKYQTTAVVAPRLYIDKSFKIPQPYQFGYFPNPFKEIFGLFLGLLYEKTQFIFFKRIAGYFDANNITFNKPENVDWVSGAAMMIKSKIFKKIGYFDERFFFYFEDIDLQRRINKAGHKVSLLKFVKAFHNWEASNDGRQKHYFKQAQKQYLNKHYPYFIAQMYLILYKFRNAFWLLLKKKKFAKHYLPEIYLNDVN